MSIIRDFVELVRNLTANLNLKVDKSSVTSGNTASTVVSRDGSGNFSAGTITANLSGTASNASKLNNQIFNWSGQAGQPTWLWGGSDGTNMYVYNPANFSVNYATSSNYANVAGVANSITYDAAKYGNAQLPVGGIGTYAFLRRSVNVMIYPGDNVAGSDLTYADGDSGAGGSPTGTWRCMGCVNNIGSSVFLRIA